MANDYKGCELPSRWDKMDESNRRMLLGRALPYRQFDWYNVQAMMQWSELPKFVQQALQENDK